MPSFVTWTKRKGSALTNAVFDPECRACPRLARFLDDVNERYPEYPLPSRAALRDATARLLIVGLALACTAPNRTGRPFTGDHAGILLYETLHKFGFSTRAESQAADDDLVLTDCRITNAVKCLPPDNKPVGAEINTCNTFLANELFVCHLVQSCWRWAVSLTAPSSKPRGFGRPTTSLGMRPYTISTGFVSSIRTTVAATTRTRAG